MILLLIFHSIVSERQYWRRVLDIIKQTENDVLQGKSSSPCPETKPEMSSGGNNVDELRVYSVKVPRRSELLENPHLELAGSLEDSITAFVLPQDLPWPVSQLALKQAFDFNRNILLKRDDPINNIRIEFTQNMFDGVLDPSIKIFSIYAWVGSPGIGKVSTTYSLLNLLLSQRNL